MLHENVRAPSTKAILSPIDRAVDGVVNVTVSSPVVELYVAELGVVAVTFPFTDQFLTACWA